MNKTLSLILFFSFQSLYPLTLDEAVDIALKNNLNLKESEENVNIYSAKLTQARSIFYPQLNLQASYTRQSLVPYLYFDSTPLPFGYPDNYSINLEVQYPIFTWGKRRGAYRISYNLLEQSKNELITKKEELIFNVKKSFWGLLLAQEVLNTAIDGEKRAKEHKKTVEEQFKKGLASKLDLLRVEVFVKQSEAQRMIAGDNLERAKRQLNLLLGREIDTPLSAQGRLEYIEFSIPEEKALEIAKENRKDFRILELIKKTAMINLDMAKSNLLPNISLFTQYSYSRPFYFEDKWKGTLRAGLLLSMPLFDGFNNINKIYEAKAEVRSLLYRGKIIENSIEFEIKEALLAIEEAQKLLSVQREGLNQAREALKVAKDQFSLGFISDMEYLDIEFQERKAEESYLSTLYQYRVAVENLKRVLGIGSEEFKK